MDWIQSRSFLPSSSLSSSPIANKSTAAPLTLASSGMASERSVDLNLREEYHGRPRESARVLSIHSPSWLSSAANYCWPVWAPPTPSPSLPPNHRQWNHNSSNVTGHDADSQNPSSHPRANVHRTRSEEKVAWTREESNIQCISERAQAGDPREWSVYCLGEGICLPTVGATEWRCLPRNSWSCPPPCIGALLIRDEPSPPTAWQRQQ